MSTPSNPPAGWYRDPLIPSVKRYWDGRDWTERTVPPTPQEATPSAGVRPVRPKPILGTGVIVAGAVIGDMGIF